MKCRKTGFCKSDAYTKCVSTMKHAAIRICRLFNRPWQLKTGDMEVFLSSPYSKHSIHIACCADDVAVTLFLIFLVCVWLCDRWMQCYSYDRFRASMYIDINSGLLTSPKKLIKKFQCIMSTCTKNVGV